MLTSLLSIYIVASLQPEITTEITKTSSPIETTNLFFNSNQNTQNPIPIKNYQYISPIINAKGSVIMDRKTGTILFGENIHERMPIASITKLMTVLIILEENDFGEIVKISHNAANIQGSTMFLRPNEEITVKNLIYGALINSANDAAIALAEHNAGNVQNFVEKMNKRALELGLINTHFANPNGFDNPNQYSSPSDVAKLSNFIYNNKLIQKISKIEKTQVRSVNGNFTHHLKSTNELLNNEHWNIKGLKTGRTKSAGLCLTTISEDEEGNEIITVVLNSPARFTETKILVSWTFRAYNWH